MAYSHDEIDLLISQAHRGAEYLEHLEQHKKIKGPKQIFAQFTNWRVVE